MARSAPMFQARTSTRRVYRPAKKRAQARSSAGILSGGDAASKPSPASRHRSRSVPGPSAVPPDNGEDVFADLVRAGTQRICKASGRMSRARFPCEPMPEGSFRAPGKFVPTPTGPGPVWAKYVLRQLEASQEPSWRKTKVSINGIQKI